MTNTLENIARGEADAFAARSEIDRHIEATRDFAKPYSVLLRWTWLALSERRADDDLRHWHRLILDVAARAEQGKRPSVSAQPGVEESGAHLAERLRALSDLIRVSIGMQMRPDKARLLTRAHVPAILQALYDRQNEAVARTDLLQAVELKTANLSRILTLLILEGLVERQADGRTARFRITVEGIKHLVDHKARSEASVEKRRSTPSVSKRPTRRLKMTNLPMPEPDLVEALRAYLEGDKQPAKRHERQVGHTYRATANVKTVASAQGKMRVSGADATGPLLPAHKLRGRPATGDVAVSPAHEALKSGVQIGKPIELDTLPYRQDLLISGNEPHGPKTVDPEYTAFEAMLPTHSPAKSADG
ncbi:hypothetical protein SAMN05216376_102152 [Mameliella alba]|uniref:hypothetical protein n=1 Tax=Mameliella alba TaxID=561184 RepID=UPI00088E6C61|nr:hypothetical protein [Mameliella alba]OWV49698.1 hypothetical protein CDZ96_04795 [Mameliella alba]PTR41686.1 hypothetical protein LX94_00977 [Mameliella alba]GGF53607.1 hypothetical protein GCM10011319_13820 [Mameliella alba]SDC33997.1 hypothetical protein SAMN05216376_102152 [Mameliella alba]